MPHPLLAMPSRLRQEDPSFNEGQLGLVEKILRETMEALAAGGF